MKKLAIFGSTGSIGENTLNVVRQHPEQFSVVCLTANSNLEKLAAQACEFKVKSVGVPNLDAHDRLRSLLNGHDIEIVCGENALSTLARESEYDLFVAAIVGSAGLLSTLEAVRRGKRVALANKETLVCAGEIVSELVDQCGAQLIPVDSEHSALFQCLIGETPETVQRIILTASGGPFLNLPKTDFSNITVENALKHPNWTMGAKITIDSASLMNKGLEVIEAHWLFNMPVNKIDVLVHPQSVIHSMVEFCDGSIKAQLGVPDMKLPIQYALAYPQRLPNSFERVNFLASARFDFAEPDTSKFPCLQLAYDAIRTGGSMPAVLNATNEVLVGKFLQKQIRFTDISVGIDAAMEGHRMVSNPKLDDILDADRWARDFAHNFCKTI